MESSTFVLGLKRIASVIFTLTLVRASRGVVAWTVSDNVLSKDCLRIIGCVGYILAR